MSLHRLLLFLVLIALAVAPFGRMNIAEAKAMPHHAPMAMSRHCDTMPASGQRDEDRSIDCMIACAAMAPGEAPSLQAPLPTASVPISRALADFFGLHPEADPPPPRFS